MKLSQTLVTIYTHHYIILNRLLCLPLPPPPGPFGKVVGRPGANPFGSPGRVEPLSPGKLEPLSPGKLEPLSPGKLDPLKADNPAPPSTLFGGGNITSFSIELRRLRLISGRKLTNGSVEFRREMVTGLDR